jgi:hypothetical protein
LAAVIASFAVEARVGHGRFWIPATVIFGFGICVSTLNAHIAWVRPWLHKRGRSSVPFSPVSIVPLLGDLSALGLWFMPASTGLSLLALAAFCANAGGLAWLIPAIWNNDSIAE